MTKKTVLQIGGLAFGLVAAAALTSCATDNPTGMFNPTPEKGHWVSLPYPRPDVLPGTVLVRWTNTHEIEPICQPGDDYGGRGYKPDTSHLTIDSSEQEKTKLELAAQVTNYVDATIGAGRTKKVDVKLSITPIVENDPAGDVQQIQTIDKCTSKIKLFLKTHKELKYASLVTSVAQVTADYTIHLDGNAGITADTEGTLAKKVGGKLDVGGSDTQTVHVTGSQMVRLYVPDDELLSIITNP